MTVLSLEVTTGKTAQPVMGILLGLLTALTWGGAVFIARFATHRIGALRSMLYMQLTGFLLLSFLLQALGRWGHLADGSGWQPCACSFLSGRFHAAARPE